MWRTLFVVALLVLSGCASAPSGTAPDGDRSDDHRALTTGDAPDRTNPWGEGVLTVAINNTANESRNFRPLVREALDFWENNTTRYVGFEISYELDPDAENPDLVVAFVDSIESCAKVSEPVGCAPYVGQRGPVSRPIRLEVLGSYSNDSTLLILKHELGHTLGLNHSVQPQSVMAPSSPLSTLPRPNASDKRLPWGDSNFTVYLAGDASDRPAVREQVRHALDYYAEGANGTVPANVSYAFVPNRTAADVVIEFTDDLPCEAPRSGSCGQVRGIDPDGDGALERYDGLRISLGDVDAEAVGWHVGYWLGYGFGFEAELEWPAPFRNATYEDRRSEWWR